MNGSLLKLMFHVVEGMSQTNLHSLLAARSH